VAIRTPLNAPYAPTHAPCSRTPLFLLLFSLLNSLVFNVVRQFRTFAPIASAHGYCARKFACHVMYRVHVVSNKMNNDREADHCHSFARFNDFGRSVTPYFSFQKQILFAIVYNYCPKMNTNSSWEVKKSSSSRFTGQ